MSYYVYQLIDPRDGTVFYVGKGCGDRMFAHERDAMRGQVSNRAKTERITSILNDGHRVVASVVSAHEDEQDALDAEAELIAALPGLTNICASGAPSGAGLSAVLRTAARIRQAALDDMRSGRPELAEFGAEMLETAEALVAKVEEMRL